MTVEVHPSNDPDRVEICVNGPGGAVTLSLSAVEVDHLITRLVELRAALRPVLSPGPTAPTYSCDDLLWEVASDPAAGRIAVILCHPGLGRATLSLGRDQVEDLAAQMAFAVDDLRAATVTAPARPAAVVTRLPPPGERFSARGRG